MSILLSILIACGGDATETTEVVETTSTETTAVVETTADNGGTEEVTTETNVTNVTEDMTEVVEGDNETTIVNE